MILASAQKNLPGIQAQLDLVHPDTEIVPGITAIAAFGHSPGQMALEISYCEAAAMDQEQDDVSNLVARTLPPFRLGQFSHRKIRFPLHVVA